MKWTLALLASVSLMSGCAILSSPGGDEDADAPAVLEELKDAVPLEKLWSTDAGVGFEEQFVKLVPAVYEGQVLVADRKGRVSSLNAQTGKRLWRTDTKAAISAGPGTGEGLVLVGTSDGEVLALDATAGTIRWRAEVPSEVLAVPRTDFGVVVIQTANGSVSGLDSDDGHRLWMFDRTVPVLTLRGTSTPALESGLVVAGFANGKLAAISAEKGFAVWESSIATPQGRSELERMVDIDADPVIAAGAVYVTTYQGRVAMVNLQNGDPGWSRDMSSHSGLGVDFSQVYVTDSDSNVWALSRDNGASLWKQDKLRGRDLSAPQPFGNYIAVGDFEGYLHLLSRYDGHIAARIKVDKKGVRARPLVSGDTLFIYGNSGTLAAYRLEER